MPSKAAVKRTGEGSGSVLREKRERLAALLAQAQALSREINPLTPEAAEAVPTWRAAYSDRTCALMATLCALAYDRFEDTTGAGAAALGEKLAAGGFLLALFETSIAKMRVFRVPDFLGAALMLGLLASLLRFASRSL